ncbi:hypothetical protein B0H11DRAFT_2427551 [Mycena galericulata]|nr:hypothetical protein B0H11DRAFT_2427551 [Mycena galericulata]
MQITCPANKDTQYAFHDASRRIGGSSRNTSRADPNVRCSRCKYVGPQSSYPRKTNLTYLKTCTGCTDKVAKERAKKRDERDADKENPSSEGTARKRRGPTARAHEARPTLSWAEFSGLLEKHGKEAFELDAFVMLPAEEDDEAEIMADDGAETAKNIAKRLWINLELLMLWVMQAPQSILKGRHYWFNTKEKYVTHITFNRAPFSLSRQVDQLAWGESSAFGLEH